jgi:predicted TPR repeat methyltransferase
MADDTQDHALDLMAQGRPKDAAAFLRRRIESGRGGLLARILFVRALIACGEGQLAFAVAQETARINPEVAVAASILGEALLAMSLPGPAIGEFQRALRLDPYLVEARFQLGAAWLMAGEPGKALDEFALVPSGTITNLDDWISEAKALKEKPRAAPGYVRHLFDEFSADYDERMKGSLGYRAPELLRELKDMTLPGTRKLDILDLGCGTGLSGLAFHDVAARIDGIDLSPQMVIKARARNVYANLSVADIETALAEGPSYDLILAADTLVYLGDLAPVFTGASARLRYGGFFLFTVEAKEGEGFELGPKRRWRHSDPYLREVAAKSGFSVAGMLQCVPRTEAGEPVPGLAVALSRA